MPLPVLESALKTWLRDQLPLPDDSGDVSFDAPEGTWGTSVTRPTVNLFLFDIARAATQPVAVGPYRDAAGVIVREKPAQPLAFSYLLSTWGGGTREEHQLLGDAVKAVLRTPTLQAGLDGEIVGPVHISLAEPEKVRSRDLWAGLGGRLRPSLVLVVTTAVTLDRPERVAPPVQRVGVSVAPETAEPTRRFVWFGGNRQRVRSGD
ncbi:Pvc16 family protein [Kineosporia succinea]|uniref:Pvc16 N-terminal domain-containing protein n=1 Tax=Kineosporia succinea TaxID=84632 RepID=A0ABT9PD30_9ACTN|nr:DUF4255 domain-containing protein [Kineosporia succinea]MDP9829880.1 hypothetical protein [Kineosporia succinea]